MSVKEKLHDKHRFVLKPSMKALVLSLGALPSLLLAEQTGDERVLEVIEVTSMKRVQNSQTTPVTLSALNQDVLSSGNITNFDDLSLYVPSITVGGRGPGQADVFIRGMAIQPIAIMLSGAQGTVPNVATYLDEQPLTAPGRNLDIYLSDIERVEVLPGPQGTLFGASSQAGTIRYITNKPELDEFYGHIEAGFGATKSGAPSDNLEFVINLPVHDKIAVRGNFYNVNRGGYIYNVYGEFTLDPRVNPNSNVGIDAARYELINNQALVEKDFNDSSYRGFRVSALAMIDEYWTIQASHLAQEIQADGVFDFDPDVGDLMVNRFYPDSLTDEVNQTALTIEGEVDGFEITLASAYLERDVEQLIDYTGYNNSGAFIAYYTCSYDNPDYIANYNIEPSVITTERECLDPTKGFDGIQTHSRVTHEFRVQKQLTEKLHFITGVFSDDFEIETQDQYEYLSATELGFAPNAPISTALQVNSAVRRPNITFFNDIFRSEKQMAWFAEFSYEFLPKWTINVGARKYDIEVDLAGSTNFADGIFQGSVNTDRGRDYDVSGDHSTEPLEQSGSILKLNLSHQFDSDKLFYFTVSEGFRPGGFNRGGGIESVNPEFANVGLTYDTDDVVNLEFGWKTSFDRRVRFNGSVYQIDWQDMQVSRFDPQNVSILTFIENAADARIQGVESNLSWQVNNHLSIAAAVSLNDTELTKIKAQAIEIVPVGSALPVTPERQGNLQLRWDDSYQGFDWWGQVAALYASSSWSSLVQNQRQKQPGYQIFNIQFGLEFDTWLLTLGVENIADERATLFINDQDDVPRITTNRPRTASVNLTYRF